MWPPNKTKEIKNFYARVYFCEWNPINDTIRYKFYSSFVSRIVSNNQNMYDFEIDFFLFLQIDGHTFFNFKSNRESKSKYHFIQMRANGVDFVLRQFFSASLLFTIYTTAHRSLDLSN